MILSKYKNIFFDLDGTLVNTGEGIINGVFYTAKELQLKGITLDVAKKFVGPPLVESFMINCCLSKEEATNAAKIFRQYYAKTGIYECELYSGVEKTLKQLKNKGFNIYVATSKPTVFAVEILQRLGVAKYFNQIVGSNLDNTRSKKNEIIDSIILDNKLHRRESIMVGDKSQDIVGAYKSNIDSVGVLYGYGDLKEIEGASPTIIIKKIEDLLN